MRKMFENIHAKPLICLAMAGLLMGGSGCASNKADRSAPELPARHWLDDAPGIPIENKAKYDAAVPDLYKPNKKFGYEDCVYLTIQQSPALVNSAVDIEIKRVAQTSAAWKYLPEPHMTLTVSQNLTMKNMDTRDFFKRALKLKEICHKHGVDFAINDRLDIAIAVDADGVHLGQSDMPIQKAKEILGHKKIIGISAKNMEEALEAQKYGADYIGVGAIFATDTKKDSGLIDLETLKEMTNQINIPVLAIGGIGLGKLGYLKDTGIDGICVISDILGSDDPEKRTRKLLEEYRSIDV